MKKHSRQKKSATPVQSRSIPFTTTPRVFFIAVVAALLLFLAIYLLRLDRVVGLYGDDAWYLLLAKALASGQGYTLTNSPSTGIMPFYPPGFSFLLSVVWRLYPQFPQNIWLLKMISIAAMLGVGVAAYYYFWREREQPKLIALGIGLATVSSPAFAFLATSTVMSECVFTLALLLAVLAIERGVRADQGERRRQALLWVLAGAALVAFAFLIRSIALGLILATILYLLRHRLLKMAAIFLLGVALFVSPWLIYSRLHAPTAEQQTEQNSYIVQNYAQQFWQRKASYSAEGNISLDELPARIWDNAYHLLEYDFGALTLYPVYRAIEPSEGRLRYWWHDYSSLLLSVLITTGFVTVLRRRITLAEIAILFLIAITVLWPFRPFRYVLPLLPWILFYLLESLRLIYRWLQHSATEQAQGNVALAALSLIIAINLVSNAGYILALHGTPADRPKWVQMFTENERLIGWVKDSLPREAVIAGQNPALVHLYTGHKGVGSTEPARNWERWKLLNVRYLVMSSYFPLGEPPEAEKRFKELYRLPSTNLRVLDLGEPAMRPPWPE